MKAKKTSYNVDGCKEPCFEIKSDDGFVLVRLAPYYHYYGKTTIIATEYLDGDFNSREEINEDFESLTKTKAVKIATNYSVYLN